MTNPVLLTTVSSDVLTNGGVYGILRVGDTPVLAVVGGTVLANRKILIVNNNSENTVCWGFDAGLNEGNGIEISPNSTERWAVTEAVAIYLVCAKGVTADIRIAEGA